MCVRGEGHSCVHRRDAGLRYARARGRVGVEVVAGAGADMGVGNRMCVRDVHVWEQVSLGTNI